MIENKPRFLENLTKLPELKDNIMSYVFAKNPDLVISPKNQFFENVKLFYQRYKDSKPEIKERDSMEREEIEEWKGKDLRIKSIRLQSIKGYPKSSTPFGINFNVGPKGPKSMIILGGNATGKSSVYDSLEYIYCNEIGEANLRSYREKDDNRFKKYLEHNSNGLKDIFCQVETIDKTFNIGEFSNIPKSVRNRINPNTHFISDYDLYENGQLDYQSGTDKSFHNKIAESIGLKKILEFNKYLKEFVPYQRRVETTAINTATKKINSLKKYVETANLAIKEKQIEISQLKSNQKEYSPTKNLEETLQLLNVLKAKNLGYNFNFQNLQKAIIEFKLAYKEYSNKNPDSSGFNEFEFLEFGLKLLENQNDCPFCKKSKLSREEIDTQVKYRIERILDIKKASQHLNITFKEVTDLLLNLLNQLKRYEGMLNAELNQIQEKIEFNSLTKLEINTIENLNSFLSGDLFVELATFEENLNYLKDKNQYVFHLLKNYQHTIEDISEYSNSLNFSNKRKNEIEKIEEKVKQKSNNKSISNNQRIIELQKEIKDLELGVKESNETIEVEAKKKEEFIEQRNLFDEIKESTKEYEQIVTHKVNDIVNSSFEPIKSTVEQVLEKYFKFDERNIRLNISKEPADIDEETGQTLSEIITARIQVGDSENYQSVGKILNTFHYRLFASMVGIAIAIASRKNTNINLPLVLDDIFYASDFENKSAIETFIKALFDIFNEFTPKIPLQLILFTHDQMIFESIANVQDEFDSENEDSIEFAKLFSFKEAEEENGYLNLVYKYPSYFTNQPLMRIIN